MELHPELPHAARIYDVLLGGTTNYESDREAAHALLSALPSAQLIAIQNRAFMHRAARFLAAECSVRQFLDIGTGIPTSPNLHEVVQAAAPEARVVYADNDPIVLAHSRALHRCGPAGRTAYIHADLRQPEAILDHQVLRDTFDLDQPVALTLLAVLHWLPAEAGVEDLVARLMSRLAVGSYLAVTYATNDFEPSALEEVSDAFQARGTGVVARSRSEVERFFDGMELVDPGVTVVHRWRPDHADIGADALGEREISLYAGVARKV